MNPKISHNQNSNAQIVSPSVSSVSPAAASTFGGATLTVSGSGFYPSSTVALADGQACLNVRVQSSSTLQCVLPPHASGDVDLIVSTPGAGSQSKVPYSFRSDLFTQVDFVVGSFTYTNTYVEGTGKTARMSNVAQFASDGTYLYTGMGRGGSNFHLIAKIHMGSGQLSSLAGDPLDTSGGTGDGPLATAQFHQIAGLTRIGRILYALDSGACTLRKIDLDAGQTSTLAGQLSSGNADPCNNTITDGDGPTAALLRAPWHMTNDGQVVYFVDGRTIRKYDPVSRAISTLVGDQTAPAAIVDGLPAIARLSAPEGLVFAGGKLFMVDDYCVREVNPATGEINTFVGKCDTAGNADGIGPSARFDEPTALTSDGTSIYVADAFNHTVRKISILSGEVSTVAGNSTVGVPGTNDGPIGIALLSYPLHVVYDTVHGLLVSSGLSRAEIDVTAVRKIH